MHVPAAIQHMLNEYKLLDYIPFMYAAKLGKIAELYESYGDKTADIVTATHYYVSSAEYFAEAGQHYRSAVLRMKAAQKYRDLGNLDSSNMQYLVASDIFKDLGKKDCFVICASQIAKNFWLLGDYDNAIKNYETCIRTNVALGKSKLNAEYMDCIGTILSYVGKYNLAILMYDNLINMTGDARYIYVGGLLRILSFNNSIHRYLTNQSQSFIGSYYGEYLMLLAFSPEKALAMYDVYKDFVGQCDLLDILLKKICDSKI